MSNHKTKAIQNFIGLIRVNQWVKNLFVFLPIFFDQQFTNISALLNGGVAFFSFSLIASAIYCFNDYIDVEFDKNHPEKKSRPIASGAIKKKQAIVYAILLLLSGVFISYSFNSIALTYVVLIYFGLNVLYTLILKNIIVLDVIIISLSFVLRIVAGGVAASIVLSHWIIIMVFLLALFLALAKRRDEVLILKQTGTKVRKNIGQYSLSLINTILITIVVVITGAYILYTLSPSVIAQFKNKYIFISSIFVVLGFYRYYKLIEQRVSYANPTKILLSDLRLQLIVLGWFVCFYILIY